MTSRDAASQWWRRVFGLRAPLLLGLCSAALALAACDEPKPVVIARFPGDAGPSAEGGSAGASESGAPLVTAPRGRVHVVDGRVLTDLDTPLRGLVLPTDTGWTLDDFELMTNIAQTSGLNAVHVYLENSSRTPGSLVAQADALVSLTAQAGLYLVLGIGTGTAVGEFDYKNEIQPFWSFYAARYAKSTHVLFEVQNNPEFSCDAPIADKTLTMERDAYQLIRGLAPDSHILLFSTTSLVQPSVLTDAVMRLGGTVDWSNASFALTLTADCLPLASLPTLLDAAKDAGVPLLVSQLPRDGYGPYIESFERAQLSWFHIRWFANNKDLASFRSATRAAGVAWCPERGSFPEDASTCH